MQSNYEFLYDLAKTYKSGDTSVSVLLHDLLIELGYSELAEYHFAGGRICGDKNCGLIKTCLLEDPKCGYWSQNSLSRERELHERMLPIIRERNKI